MGIKHGVLRKAQFAFRREGCFLAEGDAPIKISVFIYYKMEHYQILKDLAVIAVSAALAMRVFNILRLPLLLGFILTGIFIHPVLGLIEDKEIIGQLGELGVAFMMFYIGLEFNLERLKNVFLPSLLAVVFQILAMAALGIYAVSKIQLGGLNGIFLGGILAMNSTVVIVEIFTRRKDLDKYYAQVATGILIFEDLFAIFLLVALSDMADMADKGLRIMELASTTLALFSFLVAIFVVGKLFVPMILKKVAEREQEMLMFTFCLILGIGELAVVSGLSLALGAFLAGAIISGTMVSNKVERLTESFKNLFVAIFFIYTGMSIDPSSLLLLWKPILLLSGAVVIFQTSACFLGSLVGGAQPSEAFKTAIIMPQIGEFGFVIAALGISLGVIDQSIMSIALGVSLVTVFINPLLGTLGIKFAAFCARIEPLFVRRSLSAYSAFLTDSMLRAARNRTFVLILASLIGCCVYLLLLNALYVVSKFFISLFDSGNTWAVYAIYGVATLAALPLILGLLRSLGFKALSFGSFVSNLETRFLLAVRRHLDKADFKKRDNLISNLKSNCAWATEFSEVEIGELSYAAGKTVGALSIRSRTGAEIAAVRRGRFAECEIGASFRIYPEDVIILAGNAKQIESAAKILTLQSFSYNDERLSPVNAVEIELPEKSWIDGLSLADAELPRRYGVRVIAFRCGDEEMRPMPSSKFYAKEKILIVGSPENIEKFRASLVEDREGGLRK